MDTINMAVTENMPGEKVTLLSTDSADINDADGLHTIPAEYLHSLNPSGLPPSQLELKVGAPIMLLRNIDPARGLCNGTRLIVVHIELIPRFTLSTLESDMPFMLTKKQFTVKLCFPMAINKSQGQSLKYVGVGLRHPPFMHGQLYVTLSRVTSLSGVSILLPENINTTNNVVYSELLLN
ncbi:unnamed protein product [Rhizopus microsporus]